MSTSWDGEKLFDLWIFRRRDRELAFRERQVALFSKRYQEMFPVTVRWISRGELTLTQVLDSSNRTSTHPLQKHRLQHKPRRKTHTCNLPCRALFSPLVTILPSFNHVRAIIDQMVLAPTCTTNVTRRRLSTTGITFLVFCWAVADEVVRLLASSTHVSFWWLRALWAVLDRVLGEFRNLGIGR